MFPIRQALFHYAGNENLPFLFAFVDCNCLAHAKNFGFDRFLDRLCTAEIIHEHDLVGTRAVGLEKRHLVIWPHLRSLKLCGIWNCSVDNVFDTNCVFYYLGN